MAEKYRYGYKLVMPSSMLTLGPLQSVIERGCGVCFCRQYCFDRYITEYPCSWHIATYTPKKPELFERRAPATIFIGKDNLLSFASRLYERGQVQIWRVKYLSCSRPSHWNAARIPTGTRCATEVILLRRCKKLERRLK